jgi:excisionase family DNA binding protein
MLISRIPHESDESIAITYRAAAQRLSVCERTIWGMVQSGELPALRIGKSVRIPVDALQRYVEERASVSKSITEGEAE